MKKVLTWMVLLSFVGAVSGCANKEDMQAYYDLEQQRTQLVIDSINAQAADRAHNNTLMMQSFSTSMTAAAITESPTDDAMIAMAWGYQMGSPDNIQVPKLQPIKSPPTNVDYIRAWSPLVGMALPFLYPLVWGNGGTSGSGSGNSYSADNGGSIILDSGNPGSYNSVGGDYGMTNTQTDYSLVRNDSCADGDCGEAGGQGEPVNPIEGGETCEESGGYLGPDGRIYADPGFTCSCSSRAEGVC